MSENAKKTRVKNEVLLKGKNSKLYIFIHGYGTDTHDLMSLAEIYNAYGNNCLMLSLEGHTDDFNELDQYRYKTGYDQVENVYRRYNNQYKEIYLIGFSLGGTYALDIASRYKVDGVLSISTFVQPSLLTKTTYNVLKVCGFNKLPRILQVTNEKTKKELNYSKKLPTEATQDIIDKSSSIIEKVHKIQCPVILMHSVHDKVSKYSSVVSLANRLNNKLLITFRNLKHFIQFDINHNAIYNLTERYFNNDGNDGVISEKDLIESWKHVQEEQNHWSDIVFRLIVGFFTVFGALVYFSLPKILLQKPEAPYFLLFYTIINCFFIILLSLYFFYVNRSSAFLKHFIEPYLGGLHWTDYKGNIYTSGYESVKMTKRVSLSVIGFPFAISIGSFIYGVVMYPKRLLVFSSYNLLLFSCMLFGVFLLVSAATSLLILNKYTNRELYIIKSYRIKDIGLRDCIMSLYKSIEPGVVVNR